jgi:hypothetical protein
MQATIAQSETNTPDLRVCVDQITEGEWNQSFALFEDANVYQTWAYGRVFFGESNLSRLVLKANEETLAMAQVRIVKSPLLPCGVAHVQWGPLWRKAGNVRDGNVVLGGMLKALKDEFAIRRGLVLRVRPKIFLEQEGMGTACAVFGKEGFCAYPLSRRYRTLILEMNTSMEALRKNLRKDWRRNLARAEENSLELEVGTTENLFDHLIELYEQMWSKKQFRRFVDIQKMKQVQRELPEHLKMTLLLCRSNGAPVSGAAFSALGDTGLCLLAGTNAAGRDVNGSFLVKWRTISWLAERGFKFMDVGGTDPAGNPHVDRFKRGMAGSERFLMNEFVYHNAPFKYRLVLLADRMRSMLRGLKAGNQAGGA